MASYGFVYVLRNECMPGIYKIGMTERSPRQRCEELSASTAAPMPFEVVCFGEIENSRAAESMLHDCFAGERVSQNREFFRLNRVRALELIAKLREECTLVAIGDISFLNETEWYAPLPGNPKNHQEAK